MIGRRHFSLLVSSLGDFVHSADLSANDHLWKWYELVIVATAHSTPCPPIIHLLQILLRFFVIARSPMSHEREPQFIFEVLPLPVLHNSVPDTMMHLARVLEKQSPSLRVWQMKWFKYLPSPIDEDIKSEAHFHDNSEMSLQRSIS
jgi:hypothetical protein